MHASVFRIDLTNIGAIQFCKIARCYWKCDTGMRMASFSTRSSRVATEVEVEHIKSLDIPIKQCEFLENLICSADTSNAQAMSKLL